MYFEIVCSFSSLVFLILYYLLFHTVFFQCISIYPLRFCSYTPPVCSPVEIFILLSVCRIFSQSTTSSNFCSHLFFLFLLSLFGPTSSCPSPITFSSAVHSRCTVFVFLIAVTIYEDELLINFLFSQHLQAFPIFVPSDNCCHYLYMIDVVVSLGSFYLLDCISKSANCYTASLVSFLQGIALRLFQVHSHQGDFKMNCSCTERARGGRLVHSCGARGGG